MPEMPGKANEPYKSGLTHEQFKMIRHDPKLVSHLQNIAEHGASVANDMSVVPEAEYETLTQNNPQTSRARVYVRPANQEAVVDEALHSTLLKAMSAMRGK